MRHSFGLRAALIALTVALTGLGLSSSARADSGTISFRRAEGRLVHRRIRWQRHPVLFHGRSYPLSIGGLSVGLVFGGSETYFRDTVTNIRSPHDVTGIYGAAGAGAAIVAGAQIIALRNEKGAVLHLTGQQVGLQLNADLSGLSISVR